MPGLIDLRPNFFLLSPTEKIQFIRSYRKRRADDMAKPATFGSNASKAKSTVNKFQQLGLTPEEIEICKTLGLKPKDVMMLKEQANASTTS